MFALQDLDPLTNLPRKPPLPLFSESWRSWFRYRQISDPSHYEPPVGHATTIVNWPQNDYFHGDIIRCDAVTRAQRLQESRDLSLSFLHWLRTECPRDEGGRGYPELGLEPEAMGTRDGLAKAPYIRESRRIVSMRRVVEQDVAADAFPSLSCSPEIVPSVGIGSYRIDLHPSTSRRLYVDLATLPFNIPLGALVPFRIRNMIPACKNIGTTHITNGCYRLHPVEWNIGESAGILAAFCLREGVEPRKVLADTALSSSYQELLLSQGIELSWPDGLFA